MRKFLVSDPAGDHIVTESQILRMYFPSWSYSMKDAGKHKQITPENCIQDYIVINWAKEIDGKEQRGLFYLFDAGQAGSLH